MFRVFAGTNCSLNYLTIANGNGSDGGGVWNSGTLGLLGVLMYGNHAGLSGGAIYNDGGAQASLAIIASYFWLNEASSSYGGAIYNANSSRLYIQAGTQVFANSAAFAGGIYNGLGARVEITGDSQIYGNYAEFDGGGIYSDGTVVMSGGQLHGNVAGRDGGGIWQNGRDVYVATLTNVQITENQARKGGGFYLFRGSLVLDSCTLSGNTAWMLGPGGAFKPGTSLQLIGGMIVDAIVPDP